MNAKTKTAAVATSAANDGSNEVVLLIKQAITHSKGAEKSARDAAKLAVAKFERGDMADPEAYRAILAKYHAPLAESKHVKDTFSAAVSLLLAGEVVRVAASAVTTGKNAVSFTSPEMLAAGEVADPEKTTTEYTVEDVLAKFGSDNLKRAARVAREAIGVAGAGGGRPEKAKAKPEGGRLPISEEVAFILASPGSPTFKALAAAIEGAGFTLTPNGKAPRSETAKQLAAANK